MVEDKKDKIFQTDKIITVVGPTASGKTGRAVSLARHFNGEIISGDSRQVYRAMDLGTGKDLEEYGDIPYHLIDICDAGEKYNLHGFVRDFHNALQQIKSNGRRAILCGGTGLYIETVLSGVILPEVPENKKLRQQLEHYTLEELTGILKKYKTLHNTTDIDSSKRAIRAIEIEEFYRQHPKASEASDRKRSKPLESLIVGIDLPRDVRRERITKRLHARLERGMLEEIRQLLKNGISAEDLIYYGLEYKFLTLHVIGKLNYDDMVKELETAIHQFAKRQMTWFRGMERRGFKIHWLHYDMTEPEFLAEVEKIYHNIC